MSFFVSADDITQAEHYTKQTEVKRWLILMLYHEGENLALFHREPLSTLGLTLKFI